MRSNLAQNLIHPLPALYITVGKFHQKRELSSGYDVALVTILWNTTCEGREFESPFAHFAFIFIFFFFFFFFGSPLVTHFSC